MKIVEVICFGDFDRVYTDSVWANEHMSQNDNVAFPDCGDDVNCERIYDHLKSMGFIKMKTSSVIIGGNY